MIRLCLLALLVAPFGMHADNWPMWRGATGSGTANEKALPQKWNATNSIAWKIALPDRGNSTPIVWDA